MKVEEVKAKVMDNCRSAFDRVRENPKANALWQKFAQSSRRTKIIVGGIAVALLVALFISSCCGGNDILVCDGCKARFKVNHNGNSVEISYPKEITWTQRSGRTSFLSDGPEYETVSKTHEKASVGEQFQCPYCKQFMLVK